MLFAEGFFGGFPVHMAGKEMEVNRLILQKTVLTGSVSCGKLQLG